MRGSFRLGIALALCASAASAIDWKTLRRQGHVSDFAGVVDAPSKRQLEEYCQSVERRAGVRIDLVTIGSLEGEPVEDVARAIAGAWGNHGMLLVLAIHERRSWLEAHPDATRLVPQMKRAEIFWSMGPALQEERYGAALLAGAQTLGDAIQGARSWRSRVPWTAVGLGLGVIAALVVVFRVARRRHARAFGGRTTWGSRSGGGFGGFDSGDSFGGFGGDARSAGASGDW